MLDLSGISMPFTVGDVVSGGMELVGLVSGFIVLAIALMFAPRFINFIKGAIGRGGRGS